jgi:hypothetical protein
MTVVNLTINSESEVELLLEENCWIANSTSFLS